MTNKTRNRLSKVMAFSCALAIIGSLAYFTDRVDNSGDPFNVSISEEPSIKIVPTDPNPENDDPTHVPDEDPGKEIEYIWGNNNPDTIGEFVEPGDITDLSYEISNGGTGAMDVRETFVLTTDKVMSTTSPEFRLLTETVKDAYGAYTNDPSVPGVEVLAVENIESGTKITYSVAPFVLNGTVEKVTGGVESKVLEHKLVFDKYASNAFQNTTCTVDYLVEVKQHTNDGPVGGWSNLLTAKTTIGGEEIQTVPLAQ